MIYDVAIIGGGIVGLSTGHQLKEADPDLKVCVIEKETDVAQHQTKNNSGVIHSGIYYRPGSLRARNCNEGRRMLTEFCDRHHVPYELCGKLIVATSEKEIPTLQGIYEKGIKNGLSNLKIITSEEAAIIEPHVQCVRAIKVPQAGIVSYEQVAKTYLKIFQQLGGELKTGSPVKQIVSGSHNVEISTDKETIRTSYFINCAGLYADHIAQMSTVHPGYQILPFRGEYYELKEEREYLVNHLIYPVPDINFPFLGVHFTRMIGGGIEAGPNAVLAFKREGYHRTDFDGRELWETLQYRGFRILASRYWRTGLGEMFRSFSKSAFVKALQKLIPSVTVDDVVEGRSGVRAMACAPDGNLVDDFVILDAPRGLNVISAPSPAATASLAIGKEIVTRLKKKMKHE